MLLGGAAGVFVGPSSLDMPLTYEGTARPGATLGSGVVLVLDDTVPVPALLRRITRFFRDESCGQCVPCRVGTVRQEELVARLAAAASRAIGSVATELALLADIGHVTRDASICGLGQTALSAVSPRSSLASSAPTPRGFERDLGIPWTPKRLVDVEIDGVQARVPEGATLLDACRAQGIDTPTLCYLENLTPVNVCRVCVVEVEGSRTLVPSCSRKAEPGMKVHTDSDRVRTSRKMVLEFLASSVNVSLASGDVQRWIAEYGVDQARYGPPAPDHAAGERDAARAGEHHAQPPRHRQRRSASR